MWGHGCESPHENVISAQGSAGHSNCLPVVRSVSAKQFVSANGFTRPMLAGLSRAGLATARGKTVRITAEGRRALEG